MDAESELPLADVPMDAYEQQLPAENSVQRWLFFEANRWHIIVPLVAGTLLAFLALVWTDVLRYRDENAVQLLMSAFIAGNFTLITIVITVNQLVLSREFGKPHTLRERNEGIAEFWSDVEATVGRRVNPADPRQFLRAMAGALHDKATQLQELTSAAGDPAVTEEFETFTSAVRNQAADLDRDLRDTEFGSFDVLVSLLFYRIAWQLRSARRLQEMHDEALDADAVDRLEEISALLRQLNISRQYVQTLYLQRELAQLSRLLLYVGFPALVAAAVTMVAYPADVGVVDGPLVLQLVVAVASAVSFVPLAILLSYVVRISTIVSRMALLSPFISDG